MFLSLTASSTQAVRRNYYPTRRLRVPGTSKIYMYVRYHITADKSSAGRWIYRIREVYGRMVSAAKITSSQQANQRYLLKEQKGPVFRDTGWYSLIYTTGCWGKNVSVKDTRWYYIGATPWKKTKAYKSGDRLRVINESWAHYKGRRYRGKVSADFRCP